jgi:stearoyl-CoA desaturase (delta-9 desaturase)
MKEKMIELIYLLVMTHITIISVTLFLHRGEAHRGIEFHPILSHFMRFWLWLTTGMVTKDWVAIHRKHHSATDQKEDPHSPHNEGIWRVLFKGALLYHNASKDKKMVNTYGAGTPDDWVEHNIYSSHSRLGVSLLLVFNVLVFGWWGLLIWAIQMIWIPFWAAGVVNGIGHFWGYRNTETNEHSKNVFPIDFIVGGELLHNNHHSNVASSKLSVKWWEFDIGWMWLTIFRFFKLAKLTR